MSYWVGVAAKGSKGHFYTVGDNFNVTYNLGGMIEATLGANIKEFYGKETDVMYPLIKKALEMLESNPESFREYEPSNKWGTVETLIKVYKQLLELLGEYDDCYFYVS